MIQNKEDLLKECEKIFNIFSLHNWHYPFILEVENRNELYDSINNIENYCKNSENKNNDLTFSAKEIQIMKTNKRFDSDRLSIGYLIEVIENERNESCLIKDWNMTKLELQEFKFKLEELM